MSTSSAYISSFNLASVATAITATSAASGYPAANLGEPERLGLPWRSTSTATQVIVVDMGSAIAFDRIALIGMNFTSVSVQNHTAASGTPAYDSGALTAVIDPDHVRYRRWFSSPANFTRRYTWITIPSQTPLPIYGGAIPGYFELAGIWMGGVLPIPRSLRPGYTRSRVAPTVRVEAELGRWAVEYTAGDGITEQRWERFAEKSPLDGGYGGDLGTWMEYDRVIGEAPGRRFLFIVELWGSSAVWVMRQTSETAWQDDGLVVARDTWELAEAVAG